MLLYTFVYTWRYHTDYIKAIPVYTSYGILDCKIKNIFYIQQINFGHASKIQAAEKISDNGHVNLKVFDYTVKLCNLNSIIILVNL